MEILKKIPVTAALLIIIFAIAVSGNAAAFPADADNQSDIGGGSLRIDIAPMASNESSMAAPSFYSGGVWGQDEKTGEYSVLNGAVISVKVPVDAETYVAYDLDVNADIYAIKGDKTVGGVPYMKLPDSDSDKGKVYTNHDYSEEFAGSTVGKLYPMSWKFLGYSQDNSQKQFVFRLGAAGEINIRIEKNGEYETESYLVDNIDWMGPTPVYNDDVGGYMFGVQSGSHDGMATYAARVEFTDYYPASVPHAATSGIFKIYVLRFDEELGSGESTDITADNIEDIQEEHIVYHKAYNENLTTRNHVARFDVNRDGWYYYFTMDREGNSAIGPLLDHELKISGDPDYVIIQKIQGGTANVDVSDIIQQAEVLLENHAPGSEHPVNEELYNDCMDSLTELTFAFRTLGTDEESRLKKAELYNIWLNGPYDRFRKAVSSGEEFVTEEVLNDYLLEDIGYFSYAGLETAINGKGGDPVTLRIVLDTMSDKANGYNDILSAAAFRGKVIRVEYSVLLDGEMLPEELFDGEFSLDINHDGLRCLFVTGGGDGYVVSDIEGVDFDRIMLSAPHGVIYLVVEEADKLTPLWIALSVAGGLVIVAAVILIVFRKRIFTKSGKKASESVKTGADSAKSENDGKKAESTSEKSVSKSKTVKQTKSVEVTKTDVSGGKNNSGKGDYDD